MLIQLYTRRAAYKFKSGLSIIQHHSTPLSQQLNPLSWPPQPTAVCPYQMSFAPPTTAGFSSAALTQQTHRVLLKRIPSTRMMSAAADLAATKLQQNMLLSRGLGLATQSSRCVHADISRGHFMRCNLRSMSISRTPTDGLAVTRHIA